MPKTYYNEIDPYCVEWLRSLIAAGHIPPGDVDSRSIEEVQPDDLRGYTQCHFFAGLGGWSRALRLAGWQDERPVWTGSCPCQPFSTAGKRKGFEDARHLWPAWHRLIAESRPAVVFGEQVARATEWLGLVRGDLEALEYAVGCMPIEASSVGANHKRDRIWFVAHANSGGWAPRHGHVQAAGHGSAAPAGSGDGTVANPDRARLAVGQGERSDTRTEQPATVGADWWAVEPDVGRVAHGIPERVAKLRALGNAIVPQVAAEFIGAYLECREVR